MLFIALCCKNVVKIMGCWDCVRHITNVISVCRPQVVSSQSSCLKNQICGFSSLRRWTLSRFNPTKKSLVVFYSLCSSILKVFTLNLLKNVLVFPYSKPKDVIVILFLQEINFNISLKQFFNYNLYQPIVDEHCSFWMSLHISGSSQAVKYKDYIFCP